MTLALQMPQKKIKDKTAQNISLPKKQKTKKTLEMQKSLKFHGYVKTEDVQRS